MQMTLQDIIAKGWSLLLFRGIAALLLGIIAFAVPGMTLVLLITYWAIYMLIDGVFSLAASFKGGSPAPRWWMILSGLLSVGAGIICIGNPAIAATVFISILGWICLLKGAVEFIGGFMAKNGWFVAIGILSFLFGSWCLSDPLTVASLIVKIVAGFSFIAGVAFIILALKLRNRAKSLPKTIDV